MKPSLSTARLRLEPLTREHADLLVAMDADSEVMKHVGGRVLSRAESLAGLSRRTDPAADARGLGWWAGFQDDSFVGWWCLVLDEDPSTAELGYRLPRSAWGRGLATEGARAMLDQAFGTVGLDSVWAETRNTNLASQNVLAKSALRLVPAPDEAVLRYVVTRAEWADFVMAELRKHAGWENSSGGLAEAEHLAALGRKLALPRLLDYRETLDQVDLTDDAGDVADEVWRGRTAVQRGLELLDEPSAPLPDD
jgi:RimJ/RimL family protein N-acetyltransferase